MQSSERGKEREAETSTRPRSRRRACPRPSPKAPPNGRESSSGGPHRPIRSRRRRAGPPGPPSLRACLPPAAARGSAAALRAVPPVVEGKVLARLHRAPPRLVLEVPTNGLPDPLLEGNLRGDAQLGADLRVVDGVPAVVPGPVGDEPYERLRLPHRRQEKLRDLDVRPLAPAAHAVHLSGPTAKEGRLHRPRAIVHVDPA